MSVAPMSLWISFSVGILILLFIDLALFGKGSKKGGVKMALIESALWVAVALAFNLWFAFEFGRDLGIQFFTGYIVEKSLSMDNLFVILLIFTSFGIPSAYQHRVLFYGVFGAVLMRAVFILVGVQLLQAFHWILYVFGAILVVTAFKLIRDTDETSDVHNSLGVRFFKKWLPTTRTIKGEKFFIKEDGGLKATPLFMALVVIEFSDLFFAIDSIPAVFAVTQDGFVAFASNTLAVLGLRALYFVLAEWVSRLRYLKPGLATILGFIGIKLLLIDVYKVPSWVSLLVIFMVLSTAILSSWYVSRALDREKEENKKSTHS